MNLNQNFLFSSKGKYKLFLIFPFLFLFAISIISASTLTYPNSGTPTQPIITKSGFEANSNVEVSSIPEKIEPKSWWEWLLQLLNIKEEEYKDTYVVNICYTQDKYTLDKKQVEVPTTMKTYYNVDTKEAVEVSVGEEVEYKIIEDKEITRELVKATADSLKPTEFESGDKYCFYDKFTLEDLPLKYGDNSIYIYQNQYTTTLLNNTAWEANNVTHLEINNSADNSPYNQLILYYSFDADSSATAFDMTNRNNDGTYNANAFMNTTCNNGYGNCGQFNGASTDRIFLSSWNGLTTNNSWSVSVWVKPILGAAQPIMLNGQTDLTTGDSYIRLETRADGRVDFGWGNGASWVGGANTVSGVANNTWVHLVATVNFNGTAYNTSLFADGSLRQTTTYHISSGKGFTTPTALMIGQWKSAGYAYKGQMDELMFFNTSLTQAQITAIHTNQSARFKSQGTQSFAQWNEPLADNNTFFFHIPSSSTRLLGSNFGARLGYWNNTYGYDETYDEPSVFNLEAYFRGDSSYNSTNGIYNGTSSGDANATAAGVFGNSFGFDGTGDYIDTGYQPADWTGNNTNAWAVSFWIKTTNTAWKSIMGVSNGTENINYFISGGSSELYWYTREDGGGTSQYLFTPTSISDNKWHHIVAIKNYSTLGYAMVLFQDGHLVSNGYYQTANDGPFVFDYNWTLGAININGVPSATFTGSLDEIMFFNHSLTHSQVQDLYIKGRANWTYTAITNETNNNISIIVTNTYQRYLPEIVLNAGNYDFYSPYLRNFTLTALYTNLTPTINFTAPATANGTYEGQDYIYSNVTATAPRGLDKVTIYLYNSTGEYNISYLTSSPYYLSFTGLAWGTYYLNASVNDTSGETSWTETRTIILQADITKPTLIVYEPENITYTSTQVRLNGSCYDLNSPTTYYSLDSGAYTLFTFNTTIATSGYEVWHDLSVKCNDSYGNDVEVNRRFYVGNPIVNQTCPSGYHSDGYYSNGTLICTKDLDTNATTECPDGYFLSGSGTCIPIGQECPANYTSIGYYSNGTIKCRYLNLTSSGTTTPCKLTRKINEGYFPYGKLGCAIEFI